MIIQIFWELPCSYESSQKDSDFKTSLKVATKTDLVNIYLSECKAWRSIDSLAYDKVQASVKFHGELLEDQNTNFWQKRHYQQKV